MESGIERETKDTYIFAITNSNSLVLQMVIFLKFYIISAHLAHCRDLRLEMKGFAGWCIWQLLSES